jgi:hypothetical protein
LRTKTTLLDPRLILGCENGYEDGSEVDWKDTNPVGPMEQHIAKKSIDRVLITLLCIQKGFTMEVAVRPWIS